MPTDGDRPFDGHEGVVPGVCYSGGDHGNKPGFGDAINTTIRHVVCSESPLSNFGHMFRCISNYMS